MAVLTKIGFVEDQKLEAFGKPPETPERLLVIRDEVFSEELVKTVEDGHLHLRLDDDTILRVGSQSEMVLDRFVYDPATNDGELVATFGEGIFRVITGSMTERGIELITPAATIGVRGTDFIIQILAGVVTIAVLSGQVVVKALVGHAVPVVVDPGGLVQVGLRGEIDLQPLPPRPDPGLGDDVGGLFVQPAAGPGDPFGFATSGSWFAFNVLSLQDMAEFGGSFGFGDRSGEGASDLSELAEAEAREADDLFLTVLEEEGLAIAQVANPAAAIATAAAAGVVAIAIGGGIVILGGGPSLFTTNADAVDLGTAIFPADGNLIGALAGNDTVLLAGLGGGLNLNTLLAAGLITSNIFSAGAGNDTITGGSDADIIDGGAGNDRLDGSDGNDSLIGGTGSDLIIARPGGGNDVIDGGTAAGAAALADTDTDVLRLESAAAGTVYVINADNAGPTVEVVINGSETLTVDNIEDFEIVAGAGGDTVTVGDLAGTPTQLTTITFEGGAGGDEVNAKAISAAQPVTVIANGNGGPDTLSGGAGSDELYGGAGSDSLFGGAGGDRLYGGAGNDIIFGGAGDDLLFGGTGTNSLIGGAGNDTLIGDGTGRVIFDGAFADYTITITGPNSFTVQDNNPADGDDGFDTITGFNLVEFDDAIGNPFIRPTANDPGSNVVLLSAEAELTGATLLENQPGLTISEILSVTNGTAILDEATQLVTFSATPGFVGQASFTFEVTQTVELPFTTSATATILSTADVDLGEVLDGSLLGFEGYRLTGQNDGDGAGNAVASAGDINGDGIDDIVIAAYNYNADQGAIYVVFGGQEDLATDLSLNDLSGLGGVDEVQGFRLLGQNVGDYSGTSVASAGDINGDGIADLIIGAKFFDADAGSTYVVFGGQAGLTGDLSLNDIAGLPGGPGTLQGFRFTGQNGGDLSGASVSSAGDINGDGIDDLIIGAYGYPSSGTVDYGATYVIFGGQAGLTGDLSASDLQGLGGADSLQGFRVRGEVFPDGSGLSVAGAGDVNGDGIDDLIIGAYQNDTGGADSGATYIVFGGQGGLTGDLELLDLAGGAMSIQGVRLSGEAAGDNSGFTVARAGDVNDDGLEDLIIGAIGSEVTYVVFGNSAFGTDISLTNIGTAALPGFSLSGQAPGDDSSKTISAAGDVNGDGIDDLLLSATATDSTMGTVDIGASYLIFGGQAGLTGTLSLNDLPGQGGVDSLQGFRLTGEAASNFAGSAVSVDGDINGDGIDDLIIGAYGNDDGDTGNDAGAAYVIFGADFTGAIDQGVGEVNVPLIGDAQANVLVGNALGNILVGGGGADVLLGGAGDDLLANSDATVARVRGGNGKDTLRIDGGAVIDLTAIADTRIEDIEAIDLQSGGAADAAFLGLDLRELLNISGSSNRLVVTGDASDTVSVGGLVDSLADEMIGGVTFDVFNDPANAQGEQLLVQQGILIVP